MTNNNRIYEIMQEIITEKMIEESIEENKCKNKWRKISIYLFFKYLFLASISKSKSYRETAKIGLEHGLTKADYSSLSLKGKDIDYRIFKSLYKKLMEKVNRSQKRKISKKMKKVIKSVDATLLKAAPSKWKFAPYTRTTSAIKLHVRIVNDTVMPDMVEESVSKISDKSQLPKFYESDNILVCDRGYTKISQFVEMDKKKGKKQSFVIRLLGNVTISERKEYKKVKEGTNLISDEMCKLGSKGHRGSFIDHEFRVIKLTDRNGAEVIIVTNIRHLTTESIADIYKMRWQIETFFRILKQNFNISKPYGESENAVYSYAYISIIAYVIVNFLYTEIKDQVKFSKLSFIDFFRDLAINNLNTEWNLFLHSSLKNMV